jgi:hypothetical protein
MMLTNTQNEYHNLAAAEATINAKTTAHQACASPIVTPRSTLSRLAVICFILILHPVHNFFIIFD